MMRDIADKRSKASGGRKLRSPKKDSHSRWELRGAAGLLHSGSRRGSGLPKLTESQIAFIFQQADEGVPLVEICEAVGISGSAYLNWRRRFGGLLPSEYEYVQDLEAKVRRLQSALDDLQTENK